MEMDDDSRHIQTAQEAAAAIYAVPQHENYTFEQEDGWELHLKRYGYKKLTQPNEIRLLHLHPKGRGLRLKNGYWMPSCDLVHVTLDALPKYICLSYAWRSLRDYDPLLLNTDECLTVTNSLFSALLELCLDDTMVIWCDQIYEKATATLVWLGQDYDDTHHASDLLQRVADADLSFEKITSLIQDESYDAMLQQLQAAGIMYIGHELGWIEIHKLSQRPWFSRLWTVQEYCVSENTTFLCGKLICGSHALLQAFMLLRNLQFHITMGMDNIGLLEVHRSSRVLQNNVGLDKLLQDTSNAGYECSDPRDHVYALLSLQGAENRCVTGADYTKPVHVVFAETAKAIINFTRSLRILHRRRFRVVDKLPSWAPDWTVRSEDVPINEHSSFRCASLLAHIPEDSSPETLIVRGKVLLVVSQVAAHQFSKSTMDAVGGSLGQFIGAETLLPQLIDALPSLCSQPGYCHWILAMTFTCGLFEKDDYRLFQSDDEDPERSIANMVRHRGWESYSAMTKCFGRKIATVVDAKEPDTVNRVALVPDSSRAGDLICVVNGSDTPLVLRKMGPNYEYIGECYSHGIMYGEAVDWLEGEGDRFTLV